jgi:hypothetical protein
MVPNMTAATIRSLGTFFPLVFMGAIPPLA